MTNESLRALADDMARECMNHPTDSLLRESWVQRLRALIATLSTPTAPKGGREVVGQQVRWRKDDRDEWCQWMNCTGWDGRDRNEVLRGLKAEFREIYADTHPNPEASTPTSADPVAWQYRYRKWDDSGWSEWCPARRDFAEAIAVSGMVDGVAAECRQLYATPAAVAQPVTVTDAVAWQARYLDPVEGPSMWMDCRREGYEILRGNPNYEVRELAAITPDTKGAES